MQAQSTPAGDNRLELTIRGIILGGLITLVFTAANVYLGLKAGLTFASSIPAAVISMAVLRAFKSSTIYENNIVQTVASAAGTLSSIIFVLPGLVMIGWWTGFPFWESFGICAAGGILGVMYTVPLRRALVKDSDLPYPEGVAAAEVLRVGSGTREDGSVAVEAIEENKAGLVVLLVSSISSAAFAALVAARIFASDLAGYFRAGAAATGIDLSLSLALMGAGHLIGLTVGLAIFGGLVIAWGIATPIFTMLHPMVGPAADVALAAWSHKVRFFGAGTIGISAIWTIAKLAKPVWGGVASAIAASRPMGAAERAGLPRTERDIPIAYVGLISLLCLIPVAILLYAFLSGGVLGAMMLPLVIGGVVYVVLAGFVVAAACGYMAGLIGSSNSPVSGLAILAVIGASLLLLVIVKSADPAMAPALVAYALLVTAILLCVATIANDNLQDLKTGQLVDATPWRQQVALIIGVLIGAAIIPPILNLLNTSHGFMGAPNVHGGMEPFAAPQATLISALAKGVIQGQIDWNLLGLGALAGIVIIVIDEILHATTSRYRLHPLAVGLGIYLPSAVTAPVAIGAVAGWAFNRWVKGKSYGEIARRLGVLIASGLIVGESLFGVFLAGLIAGTGNSNPMAVVGDGFAVPSVVIGTVVFIAVTVGLYLWVERVAQRAEVR